MLNSPSKVVNISRIVILLLVFSYAIRLIVMAEGYVPFGDQREFVRGWPPVLFGWMLLIAFGSLVAESLLRRAKASTTACLVVRGIAFASVIIWGILRWIGIA